MSHALYIYNLARVSVAEQGKRSARVTDAAAVDLLHKQVCLAHAVVPDPHLQRAAEPPFRSSGCK